VGSCDGDASPPGHVLACPGVAEDGSARSLKSRPGHGAISRLTETNSPLLKRKANIFKRKGLSYLGGLVGSSSPPRNLLACPGVAKRACI